MTDSRAIQTATSNGPTTLFDRIGEALEAEHWARTALRTPPQAMSATAWDSPDSTCRLMVTCCPGEPPMADLTSHPAGRQAAADWSVSITDPSPRQILATSRAAANIRPDAPEHAVGRLRDMLRMVERLQRTGWILHCDDAESGVLFRLSRADRGRVVIRIDDDADQPGGWMMEGRDLRADATDGTPTAVLAALALTLP